MASQSNEYYGSDLGIALGSDSFAVVRAVDNELSKRLDMFPGAWDLRIQYRDDLPRFSEVIALLSEQALLDYIASSGLILTTGSLTLPHDYELEIYEIETGDDMGKEWLLHVRDYSLLIESWLVLDEMEGSYNFLYRLKGYTGLYAVSRTTIHTVADIDRDGNTEIIASNRRYFGGSTWVCQAPKIYTRDK